MNHNFIRLSFSPFKILSNKDNLLKNELKKEESVETKPFFSLKGYCISLERRAERFEIFKNVVPKELNIKKFLAIDGKDWKKEFLKEPLDYIEQKMRFPCDQNGTTLGFVGCFVSHYRLWKTIYNDPEIADNELVFIFEDDANFVPNWFSLFQEYTKDLNVIPNLIYFGGRFSPDFVPDCLDTRFIKITDHIYQFADNIPGYNTDKTTHCYCLSRRGAKRLMDEIGLNVNGDKMNFLPIDVFLDKNHATLELMSSNPLICWSPAAYISDVQGISDEFYTTLCSNTIHKISK